MYHEDDRTITTITRRAIFLVLKENNFSWGGVSSEVDLLNRVFDLNTYPSTDSRLSNAEKDIALHRGTYFDWQDDWVYDDDRLDLLNCADSTFLHFLETLAFPDVQPDVATIEWLIDLFNRNLSADGWELKQRGERSGRPIFKAHRLSLGSRRHYGSRSEGLVASLTELFAHEGAAKEVAVLANSNPKLVETGFDRNSRTYGYKLQLGLPMELYAQLHNKCDHLQHSIRAKGQTLLKHNEYLHTVSISPPDTTDPQWREKANAWLLGAGITNQGRVRSDNIAARECDGLLFRSQPEINLYRALKDLGVSFSPLPTFIRGGRNYKRIEPDFVIIRQGLIVVVEVDGDTVHRESPAAAQERVKMLELEGARIIRVRAERCETPDLAASYARELLADIDKLKRARQ